MTHNDIYDGRGGNVLRLQQVMLQNVKNVRRGTVSMPSFADKSYFDGQGELLGIYGENGSGKTAVLEALSLFQAAAAGEQIPARFADMINAAAKEAVCEYTFYYAPAEAGEWLVSYRLALTAENGEAKIGGEVLSCYMLTDGVRSSKRRLISRRGGKEGRSALFGKKEKIGGEAARFLDALTSYATRCLYILRPQRGVGQPLRILLPAPYGPMLLPEGSAGIMEPALFKELCRAVESTDRIMRQVVPGLSFSVMKLGETSEGFRYQLQSSREGTRFPLHLESEGIKKLFSLFNLLLAMYHDESVCLVVDELDAGLYEYLLGELLALLRDNAAGQMIFTSHNLRPLEVLDSDHILFTTADPDAKYLRLKKSSRRNLRDWYLRRIALGGAEPMTAGSDIYEINRAFRKAASEEGR